MSATRDFDVERVATNGKPATTFVVGGETFTVRQFVSAEVLKEFGQRDVGNMGDVVDAYDRFIKQAIVDAEAEKWDKVRKEADPPLTVGAIEQILWWLMDVTAGRPTEAASSSRRGRAAQAAT